MTSEGGKTCPVCTEEMDLTDLQLKPCKCGYEVCVWCWHHIMDMAEKDGREGRCPACRTPYDKEKIVSTVASVEINSERKPKLQKAKSRTYEGRKHLNDVRVLQRHLVYTMGIPANLADEDVLQRREYFGQYGKVLKASLTRTSAGAVQYSTNNTCSVYITYSNEDEAVRCIQSVHGYILQGQPLRACFGTTKYCHTWLRNMPCSNPDCVYLHDVGNQEDSFTKDEIVSAYTRSRVQQITGTTNNLERQSGNALPPPVDESCFTGTASSKPISQSPSDDPPCLLKNSPPNSSPGSSISLPAAASWGLRGLNGHPPTPLSACPNGFSKQHGDSNGLVGSLSLAANTTPVSILHNDIGKKAWVTNDDHASHSSRELGSSDSKRYGVEDHQQKIMLGTERVVVQDASPSVVSSRNMPCLDTSREDNFIKNSRNNACFVRNDLRPSDTFSDKNDNIAVNGKVQIGRPELSSVDIDSYLRNGHSDAIEPNPSVSNQLVRSFGYLGLQQSYPGHNRESLSLLPPRKVVTSEGVFASSVASNLVSKPQFQDLQDTRGALEDDLLAPAEQNSNTSETGHLLHFPLESGSINISSSSNGHSWPYDNGCGTTESFSNDHRSMQTKVGTSSNSVLSNGYTEKNVSISARLEKIFEQPNVFSSVGKYEGSNTTNHFEKKTSVDMGESSIISDILSMDFDPWDDTLASPHNVAKLLGEPDKQFGCLKTSTSKKEQSSNQSRFSFAREVDVTDQGTVPDLSRNTSNRMNTDYVSQLFQDNHEIHSDELPSGLPSEFSESSDAYYGGNISSNRFPVSRPPASAPPGFSVPCKIPPPGFSTQERINNVIDATPVNHYHGGSSLLRSQYPVHPTMRNFNDLVLIDPAILAVGAGRPSNGINDFGLDIRSTPTPRTGAYENDHTMELLMHQYLSPSQGFRYPDHIGARFSPNTDAYNTSLRFLDQSQFGQPSFQPKTEHFSHGWNNWNQTQNRNDLGFNQYFSEYENRYSYVPTRNDIYNKAFGM